MLAGSPAAVQRRDDHALRSLYGTAAWPWLPVTIIDHMSRRYPKITFQITPLEPAAMGFRELRERRVDLTVGRIVPPPGRRLGCGNPIEDRLRVVAGACSPRARRRKITMEELMHEPWLHIPEDMQSMRTSPLRFGHEGLLCQRRPSAPIRCLCVTIFTRPVDF